MAGPGFGPGLGDDAGPARIFAKSAESRVAVTLVWQQLEADGSVSARLAVAAGRNVAMTQPFDPEVPPPAARKAAEGALKRLASKQPENPQKLLAALDVLPLQRAFYKRSEAGSAACAATTRRSDRASPTGIATKCCCAT